MTLLAKVCAICKRVLHVSQATCPEHPTAPVVTYGMARTTPRAKVQQG